MTSATVKTSSGIPVENYAVKNFAVENYANNLARFAKNAGDCRGVAACMGVKDCAS
jgi:hypothetical protein